MLLVQVYPSLGIFREQPLYALCQLWELIMPDQKLTEMEKDQEIQSGANWCERTGFKMWTAKTTCDGSGRSPKPKRNTSSLSRNKFFASPGRDSYVTFSFSWFSFSKAALFTGWTFSCLSMFHEKIEGTASAFNRFLLEYGLIKSSDVKCSLQILVWRLTLKYRGSLFIFVIQTERRLLEFNRNPWKEISFRLAELFWQPPAQQNCGIAS